MTAKQCQNVHLTGMQTKEAASSVNSQEQRDQAFHQHQSWYAPSNASSVIHPLLLAGEG
jgi:hypothetical protein